eukprot:GSA120T00020523001.1
MLANKHNRKNYYGDSIANAAAGRDDEFPTPAKYLAGIGKNKVHMDELQLQAISDFFGINMEVTNPQCVYMIEPSEAARSGLHQKPENFFPKFEEKVAVPSPARKVETTIPERKVTSLAPRRVLDLANPNRNQVAKTQPRQALAARVQLAVRKLETKRMSLRGGVRC